MAKKHTNNITAYIEACRAYLIAKYGSIQPQWEITLMMLQDNMQMYEEVKKSIKANGIWNDSRQVKNPLLSTMKDLQASIMKLTQKLGVTPYDDAKIHTASIDDTDEFLEDLIDD